jgi:ribosomal protein S18 acetylase RimI-like enzyme
VSYRWRALTADDLEDWSVLTRAVSEYDDSNSVFSAAELGEELGHGSLDPPRDTVAALDGDLLVAAGIVFPPLQRAAGGYRAEFDGSVHPAHRGRGLGSELLDRLVARAREAAAERFPDAAVPVSTSVPQGGDGEALLLARGFHPLRYFHEMRAPSGGVMPTDSDGVEYLDYGPQYETEVYDAHMDAFRTHWGFAETPFEEWRGIRTASSVLRPACCTLAIDGDRVLGYVLSYQSAAGPLYLGQVGVRQAARGRGIARQMMQRVLAQARAAGYEWVELHVDSENADGAGALYTKAGFERTRTWVAYELG